MENNNQIRNTSYYRLPCGKGLIDFIKKNKMDFCMGNALKYLYRAGKKDGESRDKDMAKCEYYCGQIITLDYANGWEKETAFLCVTFWLEQAMKWDGK